MKQRNKISITIFFSILLFLGLYFNIPKFLIRNYINIEKHQINDWSSSKISEIPVQVLLDKIKKDSIINLDINFKYINSNQPYPNLFQTSDFNQGLRVEFGPETAAIIYNCKIKSCQPNGYKVVDISKKLKFSDFNSIQIGIKNNDYIKIKVNSDPLILIKEPPPNIRMDNILIGSGFDAKRVFSGEINSFTLSLIPSNIVLLIKILYYILLISIYLALIFYLKLIPNK